MFKCLVVLPLCLNVTDDEEPGLFVLRNKLETVTVLALLVD